MIEKLDDIMLDKTFAFQRECINNGILPVPISVNIQDRGSQAMACLVM